MVIYFKFQDDNFDLYPYTNDWDAAVLGNDALPSWAYNVLAPSVQSSYINPSISGYFHSMSFGNLEIIGDEFPTDSKPLVSLHEKSWYYTAHNPTNYCEGMRHLSYAVHEALTRLDNQINYADYDSDHNGVVDLIIMWFRFHEAGCSTKKGFSGISSLWASNNCFMPGVSQIVTADIDPYDPQNNIIIFRIPVWS